jgi:uncharacterized protein involved in high-affinity Fe2+ transport
VNILFRLAFTINSPSAATTSDVDVTTNGGVWFAKRPFEFDFYPTGFIAMFDEGI